MSVDSYKGESPGKKLARWEFWGRQRVALGEREWSGGRHAFLASREGGDVSVLEGLGIKAEKMQAIERNSKAADAFADRHPSVPLFRGEAGVFCEREHHSLTTLLLDFCTYPDDQLVRLVARAMRSIRTGGRIGVGLLRGREKGTARRLLARAQEIAPRLAKYEDDLIEPQALDGRDFAFVEAVNRIAASDRTWFALAGTVYYHSRTSQGQGVPMMVVTGEICRAAKTLPLRWFVKESQNGRRLSRTFEDDGVWKTEVDEEILRANALGMAEAGLDAAKLLNLPAGTVAAWKAHASRGTYDAWLSARLGSSR